MYLVGTMKFQREVFFVLLLCFSRAHFLPENDHSPNQTTPYQLPEGSREDLTNPISSPNKLSEIPQKESNDSLINSRNTETNIERSPLEGNQNLKKVEEPILNLEGHEVFQQRTPNESLIKRSLKQNNTEDPSDAKIHLRGLSSTISKENGAETHKKLKGSSPGLRRSLKLEYGDREEDENQTKAVGTELYEILGINPKQRSSRANRRNIKVKNCRLEDSKEDDEDNSSESVEYLTEEHDSPVSKNKQKDSYVIKVHNKRLDQTLEEQPLVFILNPDSKDVLVPVKKQKGIGTVRQKKKKTPNVQFTEIREEEEDGDKQKKKKTPNVQLTEIGEEEGEGEKKTISFGAFTGLIYKLLDSLKCCKKEEQSIKNRMNLDGMLDDSVESKMNRKREASPDQNTREDFFPVNKRLTLGKLGRALERILVGPLTTIGVKDSRKEMNEEHTPEEKVRITNETELEPIGIEDRFEGNITINNNSTQATDKGSSKTNDQKSKWQKRSKIWTNRKSDLPLSDGDVLHLSISKRIDNGPAVNETRKTAIDGEMIGQVVAKVIELISRFVKKFLTTLIQKLYTAGLDGRLTLYIGLSIAIGLTAGIVSGGAMAVGMGIINMCKLASGSKIPAKFMNLVTLPIRYFYGSLPTIVDKLDFVVIFKRLLDTLKDIYKSIVN